MPKSERNACPACYRHYDHMLNTSGIGYKHKTHKQDIVKTEAGSTFHHLSVWILLMNIITGTHSLKFNLCTNIGHLAPPLY
jgi:hypothetical protein